MSYPTGEDLEALWNDVREGKTPDGTLGIRNGMAIELRHNEWVEIGTAEEVFGGVDWFYGLAQKFGCMGDN